MTTEESIVDDVIAADQAEIDREQEAAPVSPSLTVEQVQAMINTSNVQVTNVVRGLQGVVDRTQAQVGGLRDGIMSDLSSQLSRQEYIAGLDESERRLVEPLLAEQDRLRDRVDAQPAETQESPSDSDAQWQQVFGFVQSFGLNPRDQRINYAILSDTTQTPEQRQSVFVTSLKNALLSDGLRAPNPTPVQAVSPPISTSGRSAATGQNPDDVRDQYIQGNLTTEQYHEQMTKLGEDV